MIVATKGVSHCHIAKENLIRRCSVNESGLNKKQLKALANYKTFTFGEKKEFIQGCNTSSYAAYSNRSVGATMKEGTKIEGKEKRRS